MAGIGNNLYPPIISAYMPAFVRKESCRVYFDISPYNSYDEINHAQVIISNQYTNASEFNAEVPAGIKFFDKGAGGIQYDATRESDDKYYIELFASDMRNGIFEQNQTYKVQIRFANINKPTEEERVSVWLNDNISAFSEWSTVCLIKGISEPRISINGFEDTDEVGAQSVFATEVVSLIGRLNFVDNNNTEGDVTDDIILTNEQEYLKKYQVKVYNGTVRKLLFDSGIIYTSDQNPNEINYTIDYLFSDGMRYFIDLEYETNNEYKKTVEYILSIVQSGVAGIDGTISIEANDFDGSMLVEINGNEQLFGNFTIRRTSSKSNFTLWEDVHNFAIEQENVFKYQWKDRTAEAGVWYQYGAQRRNAQGLRGALIKVTDPAMLRFEDIYLTANNRTLRIKYDPTISSFKRTVMESRTDTIGSKYSFIRKNGEVNYRQFPISGLITVYMDEDDLFTTKTSIYGETTDLYDIYNQNNKFDEHYDYITEREFRELVINFLHDNSVKLFRSDTEGNILIKLMDINFTPNRTLSRLVWSFSATAYEVDECSIKNYDKYNIQNIGSLDAVISFKETKISQVIGGFQANENIFDKIKDKHIADTREGFTLSVDSIYNIRFHTFETLSSDGLYEVVINGGEPLYVSEDYYIKDVSISSLVFTEETDCSIDYIVNLSHTEEASSNTKMKTARNMPSIVYYYTKVGQIRDSFQPNESIIDKIRTKVYIKDDTYEQQLLSVNSIAIEADAGAVVMLKDSFDDSYYQAIIGYSGRLNQEDLAINDFATIEDCYFIGKKFYEVLDLSAEVADNEYVYRGLVSVLPTTAQPNDVYTYNDQRKIYYNQQWLTIDSNDIVELPIDAHIDYVYEYMRGEY